VIKAQLPPALLPERLVAERYGICIRTLRRWSEDPDLGFPAVIKIRGRRFRNLAELEAWDAKRREAAA
jgi:hypothetical protein